MGKAAWIRGVAAGIAGLIALWGAWQLSRDPTPQERRTDLREWVRETEAACTTAFTSIASRGMAIDIVDLDRVVVRADHDLRRAFGRIRRLDDPKGSRMRVGAVHAAMTQVERDVSAIARASEDADRPALRRLAPSFRDHAQDFVNATADAGARECAPLGLPSLAADAVLGPVFAQDFAAFDEEYGRRLRAIFTGGDPTRKQVAGRFARAATVLRDAERDYAELAVPAVAADAARRYEAQLGRLRRQAAQLRRLLTQDDPADDPRVLRLLRGADRRPAGRADRRLRRAARMIRGRFAAVLVVVVAAGCGSGSDGSPGWATRADKACAATEHAIGKRGAPIDLRDIDRVAVRAADDGHALFARLRKLPLPDAGRARAQAVLDAVDRLEPRLDAFTQQSEIAAPRLMYDALKQARGDFDRLSRAAKAAGLRECFTARDRRAAFDALLTPLFPGQLRDVFADRDWDLRGLQRDPPPRDPDLLDDYYAERHRIQAEARERLERLLAPERVKPQLARLIGVLFDLEGAGTNPSFDAGELDHVSHAYVARYERRFRRLIREEGRARRSLLRALRSPPADTALPAASPA